MMARMLNDFLEEEGAVLHRILDPEVCPAPDLLEGVFACIPLCIYV